jgi:hypothetical protein
VPNAPRSPSARAALRAALAVAVLVGALSLGCKRSTASAPSRAQRSDAESAALVPWLYAVSPAQVGFVERDGRPAFTRRFGGARRFHEGRAAVTDVSGKAGFIDGDGTVVVPMRYDLVGDFRRGHARAFRFRKPILGPVQGLVLAAGELTEMSIDRQGHESAETKKPANMLPDLAGSDAPLFEEHSPRPAAPPRRWETFSARTPAMGLRETTGGREVFPARYSDFRLIEDVDGSGVKFLAARGDLDTPPPGPTWTVHDLDGKVIHSGAFDVGAFSSEGSFVVSALADGGDVTWSAVDGTGRRLVSVPFASGPFAFRDGIAEVFVADVGGVFVGRDGRMYADPAPIDERHRAVGRKTSP